MSEIIVGLIRTYRALVSPWVGRNCRFYPSCSAYAQEAIVKKGLWAGFCLTGARILKCHPFHPGGYAPLE